MKAIAEATTLVLAGSFNPAILSPQWVARNALGYAKDTEFQVEVLTPVGGGQNRISFGGISYAPGFRAVTLFLDSSNAELSDKAVRAAAAVLSQLPHTPINGLGFNFSFRVSEPSERFLSLLTDSDHLNDTFATADVVTRKWGNTLSWDGTLVSVECELAGGEGSISFNFHHSVDSAAAAETVLRTENKFATLWDHAVAAARAICDQDLET